MVPSSVALFGDRNAVDKKTKAREYKRKLRSSWTREERDSYNAYIKQWRREKKLREEAAWEAASDEERGRIIEARKAKSRAHYSRYYKDLTPEQKEAFLAKSREKDTSLRRRREVDRPEKLLLDSARGRARRAGIEFSLTEEDIKFTDRCPILNIPMKFGVKGPSRNSPSLDRLDPTKGYVPGNVQVISFKANTMKNDATAEMLLDFASWVLRTYAKWTSEDCFHVLKKVGIGPRKAEAILADCKTEQQLYNACRAAYTGKYGMDGDRFLEENAKLLWIRRKENENWAPPL